MLYQLGNIGIHDVVLTNSLVVAVEAHNKLVAEALDKLSDKKQEEKDAADWMERQQTMEEMQEEIENEHIDNKSSEDAI